MVGSCLMTSALRAFCSKGHVITAHLITKEAFTKVPNNYVNFADVFFSNLAFELPEHTEIKDYTIKLVNDQQPSYGPIYSLRLVEFETLKAYIETTLTNGFIRPSKSPISDPIFFDLTSDIYTFYKLRLSRQLPIWVSN